MINDYLTGKTFAASTMIERYLAFLVARFLHIDVEWPKDFPAVPNIRILRHELAPWLPLSDEEKQQLTDVFGGEPLLSRIRYKQPWELLLEELTPRTETSQAKEECQVPTTSSISIRGGIPPSSSRPPTVPIALGSGRMSPSITSSRSIPSRRKSCVCIRPSATLPMPCLKVPTRATS